MRAYHGVLERLGVKPRRSLEEDMKLQTGVMSYGGDGKVVSLPPPIAQSAAAATSGKTKADRGCGCKGSCNGKVEKATTNGHAAEVDFTKMTPAQKVAYHKARWDRILG